MRKLPDIGEALAPILGRAPIEERPLLLASAERLGAATWRSFARHDADAKRSEVFAACALLEEESAAFLESLDAAR